MGFVEGPGYRLDSGVFNDDGLPPGPDAGVTDVGVTEPHEGPAGFVGGPCAVDADCPFEQGRCLVAGFPKGACVRPCDRLCPDADGYPVTFCADTQDLSSAAAIGAGVCVSRCDFGEFPGSGCRPEYGCRTVHRANDSAVRQQVCLPGTSEPRDACYAELSELGVAFEPTLIADDTPTDHPELSCHVEAPVVLTPPLLGIDLRAFDNSPTPRVKMACQMAKALARSAADLAPLGVVSILHLGTYNCRVIAGTNSLSRHGYGDAIDLYGFELEDGSVFTVSDDWEDDTDMPLGEGGSFLYQTVHRWHDDEIWSIILTPNYNAAHDNHFHVDLTPGSSFLRFLGSGPYLGRSPHGD